MTTTRKKPVPPSATVGVRPGNTKDTPELRAAILDVLRTGTTGREACERCSVAYSTVKGWKANDPEFHKQWKEAFDEGTEVLEKEAERRAVEGNEEVTRTKTTSNGPKGCTITETETVVHKRSDTLLNIMLQARRPDKYRNQKVELSGPDGGPLQVQVEVEFVEGPKPQKSGAAT